MQWRNTAERYGIVSQTLHWLIVIGLIASYFIAEAAEDDEIGGSMGLHRSIGITILILAFLRRSEAAPQLLSRAEYLATQAAGAPTGDCRPRLTSKHLPVPPS